MSTRACPRCGSPLAGGAAACASCGWTSSGGHTRVATDQERAEVLASGLDQVVAAGTDALMEALRADLGHEYEIESELGRGGMAVVYKAHEKDLFRPVALKVLPPGHGGAAMAERFKREARMAAALDHPNIIPVYRVGQAAGTYYFAMKYVEGRALDAIVQSQGALPVPVIVQILRSAASALAFAHQRGIVHRDIKGANILVDVDGRVLVSDFGIARATEEKALTASGSVMGTPHFMSPEQCAGQKVGPQSDQYSLGILTFQMLTGSVPFDAESLMGILQHHFFTPVPDVGAVRPGVPPQLLAIVLRSLAKDPAGRYANTRDMLADVERVPVTDGERIGAEEMLRKLAVGELVPKVRTASLPPLPDARASGGPISQVPTVPLQAVSGERTATSLPPRRSRVPLVAAAVVVLAAGLGTVAWQLNRAAVARARVAADSAAQAESLSVAGRDSLRLAALVAARDSTARAAASSTAAAAAPAPRRPRRAPALSQPAPAPPAAPAVTGSTTLSLRTVPTNADVSLDGKALQQGGVIGFQVPAGHHRLVVSASGCVDFRTTFDAQDGVPVNLHTVTLQCQ